MTAAEELEKAIEEYKVLQDAMSVKERALEEKKIWSLVIANGLMKITNGTPRRQWFFKQFGGQTNEYDYRARILAVEEAADPLWEKIQARKMTTRAAAKAVQLAKADNYLNGTPLSQAILNLLGEYMKAPEYRTENGVIARRVSWDDMASRASRVVVGTRRPSSTPVKPASKLSSDRLATRFRAQMRALIDAYIGALPIKLADNYLATKVAEELREWIALGCEKFTTSLKYLNQDSEEGLLRKVTTRTAFRQACEVLALDVEWGEDIDKKQLRRNMGVRVKDLHPDKREGSHEMQQEYQAVIDAYDLLLEYQRQRDLIKENKKNGKNSEE